MSNTPKGGTSARAFMAGFSSAGRLSDEPAATHTELTEPNLSRHERAAENGDRSTAFAECPACGYSLAIADHWKLSSNATGPAPCHPCDSCDELCGEDGGWVREEVGPGGAKDDLAYCRDCFLEARNTEPPEPDGEAFRGGEAEAWEATKMAEARRLK